MVPRIKKSIEDLSTNRHKSIGKSLKPIAKNLERIFLCNRSIGSRYFVIGASDRNETGNDYSDWRFKTKLDKYDGMYYERWLHFEKNIYFLERIYFHLYELDLEKTTIKEFVLLHCDSAEPVSTDHSKYKRSPHLHISCAPQPIPHAHIALNNYDLDVISESLNNLDKAIRKSIEMIEDQIIKLVSQKS